jgi:YfiH family protein
VLHPTATPFRVKQVHGNTVLSPSEVIQTQTEAEVSAMPLSEPPAADGLITEQGGQSVWVCSADCTPVLIADVQTRQVAAVHAGWRGTALKIVPQAIARLQAQGSCLQDLRIAMGPAIAGEMYQVSEQVAVEVGTTIATLDTNDLEKAVSTLHQLANSPLLEDPQPGRVRLDVRRVNALQLEQLGVSADQIAIAPHCTYQDPENFFSYRRRKEKKAQWSGIVSC